MPNLFPPGDISWRNDRPQSAWREFNFAYNQVKQAILPKLPLDNVIKEWNEIAKSLAERPRKRQLQLSEYFSFDV